MKRIALVVPFVFLAGCGHTGALREEAAADFNCPQREIVIHGGGKTRDVDGCGQRATYRWTGRTWSRESGSSMSPVTPGGPPPVRPAQPAGPQPIRVQPTQPAPGAPTGTPSQPPPGPQAPLPPTQPPPGQSL